MKAILVAILTFATLTFASPTRAAVGGLIGNPVVIYVGLAITAPAAIHTAVIMAKPDSDLRDVVWWLFVTMPAGILGLAVLDGEEGQSAQFNKLSAKNALELGISEAERLSYNSQLDEANMIASEVESVLANTEASAENAKQAWLSLKDNLAPETFSAMQKISQQTLK